MRIVFVLGISLTLCLASTSGCADGESPLKLLSPARVELQLPSEPQRAVEFETGFAEALAEAQRTQKPLLVLFSAEECVYCRQMLEESFRDRQVVELAKKFVCVHVESDESPQICEDFHIEAFPTIQFIAADGVRLHRVLGKKEPETLASQMQAALQSTHTQTAYRSRPILR